MKQLITSGQQCHFQHMPTDVYALLKQKLCQYVRTFLLMMLLTVASLGVQSQVALAQSDSPEKQPSVASPSWESSYLSRSWHRLPEEDVDFSYADSRKATLQSDSPDDAIQTVPTQTNFDCTADTVTTSQTECEALVAIYHSTDGPNWLIQTNWLVAGISPCDWFGVICHTNGYVVTLDLDNENQGNRLAGPLPAEIGNLESLEQLSLSGNQLTSIPAEIGALSELTNLSLALNGLTSVPEELGNLANLEELWLSSNQLSEIPFDVENLTNLTTLSLASNQIDRLPFSWAAMTKLTELHLNSNLLTELPDELGDLPLLTILWANNNQLTELPANFGQNLPSLIDLWLNDNQLATIPATLGELSRLEQLQLYNNQLTVLPVGLGSLSELKTLSVSGNALSSLPSDLGQLPKLTTLWLSNNQLEWLPTELGDLAQLDKLSVYSNQLVTVPNSIGNLTTLTTLDFERNQLTELPAELEQLENLTWVDLSSNQLTELPDMFGNFRALEKLYLNNNRLSSVPPTLGSMSELIELRLYSNQLTNLPTTIGGLAKLTALYLYENQLTTVPESLGDLTKLTSLSIRDNKLTSIPDTLVNLIDLSELRLENNALTAVPLQIGELITLTTLTLSGNNLVTLPNSIGNLSKLTVLHLQDNQLTSIPESIGTLTRVRDLPLNNNQLVTLPDTIVDLTQLQKLYVWNNQLQELPANIDQLSNLRELRVQNNQLTTIPDTVVNLSKLSVLRLDNNLLAQVPDTIDSVTTLTELYLGSNALVDVPTSLGNLTGLTLLLLTSNQLESLPSEIAQLSNLTLFDVSYNKLTIADETLLAFVNTHNPQWSLSQTVSPKGIQAIALTSSDIRVEWDLIDFRDKDGFYQIRIGTGNDLIDTVRTINKHRDSHTFTGLEAGTTYWFELRTYTPEHSGSNADTWDDQKNELWSDFTDTLVEATTLVLPVSNTPTPSPTPTSSPNPTPSPTPTVDDAPDECSQAQPIEANGVAQSHAFDKHGDVDWVKFTSTAEGVYRVTIEIPDGSRADIDLAYYKDCDEDSAGTWNETFAPGVRLDINTKIGQSFYVRSKHTNTETFGIDVEYELSVQQRPVELPLGPVIILAGRYLADDVLQKNIDQTAQNVYDLFISKGINSEDILLLSTNENLPGHDQDATLEHLETAITSWAKSRVSAAIPLTLYLIDHGLRDLVYIDGTIDQELTTRDLNRWLTELEEAIPGLKTNIIIEACYSGSFIQEQNGTISKPGRLIMTSTNAHSDAHASQEGSQPTIRK
ncbi:MAG: leucine-rich repeat domain-containing protein, partial [Chloroflexota bacterium]